MNTFNISQVFSDAWKTYTSNFWLLLGAQVVLGIIYLLVLFVMGIGIFLSGGGVEGLTNLNTLSTNGDPEAALAMLTTVGPWMVIGFIGFTLVSSYLSLGLLKMYLKTVRGDQAGISDIFKVSKKEFGSYLLASILVFIISFVAFALVGVVAALLGMILPALVALGVIAGVVLFLLIIVRFAFYMHLIVDKGEAWYQSLKASNTLAKPHFWNVLGVFVLVGIIAVVTSLVLALIPIPGLHFIFVTPLLTLFVVAMYVQLVDGKTTASQEVLNVKEEVEDEVIAVEEA